MSSELYWGVLWRSSNTLDGKREYFLYDADRGPGPVMFRSRSEARAYRDKEYGYIRKRIDLKLEPHGWKLPRVVRVRANYEVV